MIQPDSKIALVGPNGIGKTSLLMLLAGLRQPTAGKVNIAPLTRIGYLRQEAMQAFSERENTVYEEMITAFAEVQIQEKRLRELEDLMAQGEMGDEVMDEYGTIQEKFELAGGYDYEYRIKQVLQGLGFDKTLHETPLRQLSGGQQTRALLARLLLEKPELLILDEPFSGLDPINTTLIKDEIRQLNASGISIIFSTHRMEQVEEMCDHIVLINQGKNVLYGEVKAIKNEFKENLFRIETADTLPDDFDQHFQVASRPDGAVVVQLNEESSRSNELLRYLLQHNIHVSKFEEILPTFNEIFIRRVEETQQPSNQ